MRIWIDIANAPHAPFFAPISDELERRGHRVIVTAWDRGQARALAEETWPGAILVGSGYERGVFEKGLSIWRRARALARRVRHERPDLALGHGSYAQVMSARMIRCRATTMLDYEHQPANHLSMRLAHRVVMPRAIPLSAVRRMGATARKTVWYDGFKEDVTLSRFRPDPRFRETLGVAGDDVLVTVRPPAEGALYHRESNPIFRDLLARLVATGAVVLVTPRTTGQGDALGTVEGVRILREAVSGADLLWASDLVVGAGGTMTREAAILGVPSVSIFSQELGAVDRALVAEGRLLHVTDVSAFPFDRVKPRERGAWNPDASAPARVVDAVLGPGAAT
ncbi:MAG: DUF354 domain-containing protein [Actinomycetota bacterium]|nr:DUF354 domain-containing protein [Actinomycetota bacterium]